MTKLAENRERLICCLSLEDQMVDRFLFYGWQMMEIKNVDKISSKAGWSPIPDGYKALVATFNEQESLAADKKAWDITYAFWLTLTYVLKKLNNTSGVNLEWLRKFQWIVIFRLLCVLGDECVIRFPDGMRVLQLFLGFMKSGFLLTLSINSSGQEDQHALAWIRCGFSLESLPLLWTMGDDSLIIWKFLRSLVDIYIQQLKTTGCVVKHAKFSREFVGFYFPGKDVVEPLYQEKHRFALRYLKPQVEAETLLSYGLLYALSEAEWIRPVLQRSRYSRLQFKNWAKGLVPLGRPTLNFAE